MAKKSNKASEADAFPRVASVGIAAVALVGRDERTVEDGKPEDVTIASTVHDSTHDNTIGFRSICSRLQDPV